MSEPIDLEKLLKNHKSGWVAVSTDYKKVIATGGTISEVTDNLDKTGKEGILVPASENYQNYLT
jgi:hypothetical protein